MERSERLVLTIEHVLSSSEHPSASIECGVGSSLPTPAGAYSRWPESRTAPSAARLDSPRSSCTELHRSGAHLCGRPDASRSVVVGSVHAPNVDGLERFRRQLRTKGKESASLSSASHSARGRQPVSQTYAYRADGSRDGWRRALYRVVGDQRRVVASGAVLMVVSEGNGKNEPEGVA